MNYIIWQFSTNALAHEVAAIFMGSGTSTWSPNKLHVNR